MERGMPVVSSLFQFTLPRGERPYQSYSYIERGRFNSRSREGSDLAMFLLPAIDICFNSRSREGSDSSPRETQ